MSAHVELTLAECEALMLFLAERAELWRAHAGMCGVGDPDQTAAKLAGAHHRAIAATKGPAAREARPGRNGSGRR